MLLDDFNRANNGNKESGYCPDCFPWKAVPLRIAHSGSFPGKQGFSIRLPLPALGRLAIRAAAFLTQARNNGNLPNSLNKPQSLFPTPCLISSYLHAFSSIP